MGSWPRHVRGGGAPQVVGLAADQAFSSTTVADVEGMSFSVRAGRRYHFRFVLLWRSSLVTSGLRATVTIPAATAFGARLNTMITGDAAGRDYVGAISTSGDEVGTTNVETIDTDYVAVLEGVIVPSADGTVQLRAGCEATLSTCTIRAGSVGYLHDLGP